MTTYPFEFDCSKCGKHVKGSGIEPHTGDLCFDCRDTEANKAAGFAVKNCKTCGVEIAPKNPEVEYCYPCGHIAFCHSFEDSYKDVIEFLQQRVNANANMTHTGGGCMAIEIPGDNYYLLVTDGEGPLPDRPDLDSWFVSIYDNAGNGDGTDVGEFDSIEGPSLDALGTLMERFIAHARADLGITDFEYGLAE